MIPEYRGKTPIWMTVIIIVAMLPVFLFPTLLGMLPPDSEGVRAIVWCYPFYVIMSGFLAYVSYGSRPEMSWILLILMVLSHAAVWMLAGGEYL